MVEQADDFLSIFSEISGESLSDIDSVASIGAKLPEEESKEQPEVETCLEKPIKKRGRPKKETSEKETLKFVCPICARPCTTKQKLKYHMSSSNCIKKTKRDDVISKTPHESIGDTLKECIEQLKENHRLNAPEKRIRYH